MQGLVLRAQLEYVFDTIVSCTELACEDPFFPPPMFFMRDQAAHCNDRNKTWERAFSELTRHYTPEMGSTRSPAP